MWDRERTPAHSLPPERASALPRGHRGPLGPKVTLEGQRNGSEGGFRTGAGLALAELGSIWLSLASASRTWYPPCLIL